MTGGGQALGVAVASRARAFSVHRRLHLAENAASVEAEPDWKVWLELFRLDEEIASTVGVSNELPILGVDDGDVDVLDGRLRCGIDIYGTGERKFRLAAFIAVAEHAGLPRPVERPGANTCLFAAELGNRVVVHRVGTSAQGARRADAQEVLAAHENRGRCCSARRPRNLQTKKLEGAHPQRRKHGVEKNQPVVNPLHAGHPGLLSISSSFVLLAACLFGVAACGGGAKPAADASQDGTSIVGNSAPDVEFAPLRGDKALKLSALRGKVVLLDFWASWCVPCQEELPLLDDMAGRLSSKGIEFIGVSIDEDKADAEHFLERKKSWALSLGHDPEQTGAKQFNPPKMPTSYVIDRKGVVQHMNAGFERADIEKVEAQLTAASAE